MNRRLAWVVVSMVLVQACNCGEPGPGSDAGTPDAGLDAGADGGRDAGPGEGDAGTDAGTGSLAALYVHLDGQLHRADPLTGELTPVGPTGQTWIALAWDDSAQVARAIIGNFSPVGGAATPRLATVDLCTGAVTPGPVLAVGGTQVRRAEALARDPDGGAFFLTFGRTGTAAATQYVSESTGTVDVGTGAVTVRGDHQTLQDDGDGLLFHQGALLLLDVATDLNQGALYRLEPSTGAATKLVDVGPKVLRVAGDPTRGVVFASYGDVAGTNRGLGTLDAATGVLTRLDAGLPDSRSPGVNISGLLVAPPPRCP